MPEMLLPESFATSIVQSWRLPNEPLSQSGFYVVGDHGIKLAICVAYMTCYLRVWLRTRALVTDDSGHVDV